MVPEAWLPQPEPGWRNDYKWFPLAHSGVAFVILHPSYGVLVNVTGP